MGNGNSPANLHETRKEMAAAKRRHPAGKQAPAKTPAKKAPARKAPAKKAAPKQATSKLRWEVADKDTRGKAVPATGTCGGHTWAITGGGKEWTVTHTSSTGRKTVLTDKPVSYAAAYRLCVEAARKAVA
jgi:hypothetical protein